MKNRILKYTLIAVVVFVGVSLFGGTNKNTKIASTAVTPTPSSEKTVDQFLSQTPTITPTYTQPTKQYQYEEPTNTPDPMQQYNYVTPYQYQQPTPMPIYQSQSITCTTSGNYTHCSDGSSSMQSGSTTFVNGGENEESGTCNTSGSYTHCSDGSSAINSGNVSFVNGNGGSSTCFHNGNTTTCN